MKDQLSTIESNKSTKIKQMLIKMHFNRKLFICSFHFLSQVAAVQLIKFCLFHNEKKNR